MRRGLNCHLGTIGDQIGDNCWSDWWQLLMRSDWWQAWWQLLIRLVTIADQIRLLTSLVTIGGIACSSGDAWSTWLSFIGEPTAVSSSFKKWQAVAPAVPKSGKKWQAVASRANSSVQQWKSGKQCHQQMHFFWLNCHESSFVKWMVVVPALLRLNSPAMSITSGIALAARINYLVEPSSKMLLIWAPLASAMIFWNQDWLSCPIKSGCIVRRHLLVFEFIWTTSAVLADLNTFHKPDWSVNSEGVL